MNFRPEFQTKCDKVVRNPLLDTPPPEPERPKPPFVRKRKVWNLPPRFPLITVEQYLTWCNHLKELQMAKPWVDDKPPQLFPELYLKQRKLNTFAKTLEANMHVNKELLKRINIIQRKGGWTDCWMIPAPDDTITRRRALYRQRHLNVIHEENLRMHQRFLKALSDQPTTKQLARMWKRTKEKLIMGASLPFILFKTETIDRGIRDPAFDNIFSVARTRVLMEFRVPGGVKIGVVLIELFEDIAPKTCNLFLSLVKGDKQGYAYKGTRIFLIIPGLYCRVGDVKHNNGYGDYTPATENEYLRPENFKLKHSVPGVMSMAVSSENEVFGQFNIIFKPLPQLNGKHVVFGRIISGNPLILERISANGRPLGTTFDEIVVTDCGYFGPNNKFVQGKTNNTRFITKKSFH